MKQSLCSTRHIANSRILVLQLEPGTYGSLDLDRLQQLDSDLREVSLTSSAADVIVDLSALQTGGSGFLGCISRFRDDLVKVNKRLVLCSDPTKLITLVGWSNRMNLQPGLQQAIEHITRAMA